MLERSRPSITPHQRRLLQQRRRQAVSWAKARQYRQSTMHLRSAQDGSAQRVTTPMAAPISGSALSRSVKDLHRTESKMVPIRTSDATQSGHLQHQHPPRLPTRPSARRGRSPQGSPSIRVVGHCLRLGILGVGLAVVAGTAIAILHPSQQPGTLTSSILKQEGKSPTELSLSNMLPIASPGAAAVSAAPVLDPVKELETAKAEIQSLLKGHPELAAGLFFYDPDSGAYVDLNGDQPFAAASTIKLPLLIAFFQDVDAGKIQLDEQWVMRKDLVASESGNMQYQPVGTKFSALETVENMITVSDNTATNMVLDRLGKADAVNQRFQSWGLNSTVIHNPLPDLEGTNLTSAKDLTTLLTKVSQGELLTPHSRDRALEIMRHTVTNTMLPQGLEEGAIISHKTGDIGTFVGDAGLISMPNGQRYLATVMMKRAYNDPQGPETIRKISQIMYQAFKKRSQADAVKPAEVANAGTTAPSNSPD